MHAVSSNIISSNCSGLRGTYQGLTATVLKQGTNQAIRFYVMNALRNWYKGEKLQNTWILSPAIFITYFSILSIKIWIYKKKETILGKRCIQLSQPCLEPQLELPVFLEIHLWMW